MPDFLIVNIDRTREDKGVTVIMPYGRPSRIYSDREIAEKELIRLAAQNKGEEFILFQSMEGVEYRDGQVFVREIGEYYGE